MTEDKKQNDKNVFKIKCIFNERGENINKTIEKAFENYCRKKNNVLHTS